MKNSQSSSMETTNLGFSVKNLTYTMDLLLGGGGGRVISLIEPETGLYSIISKTDHLEDVK